MGRAAYEIMPYETGWGVAHDGGIGGPYATKEAAFEAAAAAASLAMRQGHAIEISAPGREAESVVIARA